MTGDFLALLPEAIVAGSLGQGRVRTKQEACARENDRLERSSLTKRCLTADDKLLRYPKSSNTCLEPRRIDPYLIQP